MGDFLFVPRYLRDMPTRDLFELHRRAGSEIDRRSGKPITAQAVQSKPGRVQVYALDYVHNRSEPGMKDTKRVVTERFSDVLFNNDLIHQSACADLGLPYARKVYRYTLYVARPKNVFASLEKTV